MAIFNTNSVLFTTNSTMYGGTTTRFTAVLPLQVGVSDVTTPSVVGVGVDTVTLCCTVLLVQQVPVLLVQVMLALFVLTVLLLLITLLTVLGILLSLVQVL